ncbi:hypothetical protein GE061_013661 [Apolygus lucorum]|uniref:Uncharacterized protein n=1 Tax=Apolygus lucorum TaxID=248454 RepID=A0A8S9XSH3_APOLU|nr:hypothetical protein GE061_013661 [Apolygus lucorum]
MTFMLQYWFAKHAPNNLKKIEAIFPIPGHSFIPPDRVFAQIEKKLEKIETLVEPSEFDNILSERGTVFKPGRDYADHDWKKTSNAFLKPPAQWHFKFAPTKRFFITKRNNKVLVQGEVLYKSEVGARQSVLKNKRSIITSKLTPVVPGTVVKPLKLRDVQNLLTKHFGPNWDNDGRLTFHKNIFASAAHEGGPREEEEKEDRGEEEHLDEICEPIEDDDASRV